PRRRQSASASGLTSTPWASPYRPSSSRLAPVPQPTSRLRQARRAGPQRARTPATTERLPRNHQCVSSYSNILWYSASSTVAPAPPAPLEAEPHGRHDVMPSPAEQAEGAGCGLRRAPCPRRVAVGDLDDAEAALTRPVQEVDAEIGRASCRERGEV